MSFQRREFDNLEIMKAVYNQYLAGVQADKDFIEKAKLEKPQTQK